MIMTPFEVDQFLRRKSQPRRIYNLTAENASPLPGAPGKTRGQGERREIIVYHVGCDISHHFSVFE